MMNMNNIRSLVLLTLILLSVKVTPQIYRCGTELTDNQQTFEMGLSDTVHTPFAMNRTFHISMHIVRNREGATNMDMSEFNAAFAELNSAFDRIKSGFSISSVNYIDNYHFDSIVKGKNEDDMVIQNHIAGTINLYLVSHLYDKNDQEVCGYTYYPAEKKEIIMLSKSCLADEFLIEQFGHFFNLYHTHENGFAEELADGTNCSVSGDLCCDTPADPGLEGKVTPDCRYASDVQDANGNYYAPSVFNYMSFSPGECNKCYFSEEQYVRIINCILLTKSHLW
jgi:hypothetical protein